MIDTMIHVGMLGGTALTAFNTYLIWQLRSGHDSERVDRLVAALLHKEGETRAAEVVSPTPAQPTVPKHERPKQVGLSPR